MDPTTAQFGLALLGGKPSFAGLPSSMSFPSSATSGVNATGSSFNVDGTAPWNVNLGGSGTTTNNASATSAAALPNGLAGAAGDNTMILIAIAALALLVVLK